MGGERGLIRWSELMQYFTRERHTDVGVLSKREFSVLKTQQHSPFMEWRVRGGGGGGGPTLHRWVWHVGVVCPTLHITGERWVWCGCEELAR